MLIVGVIVLVIGIIMLLIGLRGRRVNDHPICRGCGFDLYGIHGRRTHCPECGGDLALERRVRYGQRIRMPRVIVSAILLLLIGGGSVGFQATAHFAAIDLNPYKATVILIWESARDDTPATDDRLVELITRLTDGRLRDEHIIAIAEAGLDRQADTDRPWSFQWGDFIELARQQRVLPDAHWERYLSQGIPIDMSVDGRIREGNQAQLRFESQDIRLGQNQQYQLKSGELEARANGERLTSGLRTSVSYWLRPPPDPAGGVSATLAVPSRLPAGQHELEVTVPFTVTPVADSADPVEFTHSGTFSVRVFAEDEQPFALIESEFSREQLAAQFRVSNIEVRRDEDQWSILPTISVREAIAPFGFEVILRIGERELSAGMIVGDQQMQNTGWAFHTAAPAMDEIEAIDVILRPNREAAFNHPTIEAIVNETIILPNQPVTFRE